MPQAAKNSNAAKPAKSVKPAARAKKNVEGNESKLENHEAKLTKTLVENAAHPKVGDYTIRDTEIHGLALRVSPGAKTWIVRRKLGGKSFRHALGHFPAMTLEKARRDAQKAMGTFAEGKHPALEKAAQVEATTKEWLESKYTVADMWADYKGQDRKPPFSKNTLNDFKRLDKRMAGDPIWQIPFGKLTGEDALAAFNRFSNSPSPRATNGGKTTANLYFRMLRSAAEHVIVAKKFPAGTRNEFKLGLAKSWHKTKARQRTLIGQTDSLKRWWDALEALRVESQAGDKRKLAGAILADYQALVLLWGGRKSETLAVKWSDLDFSMKIGVFQDTKNGEAHYFPIGPLAESILMRIKGLHEAWGWQSDYVFAANRAGRNGAKTHIKEPESAMRKVAQSAGVPFSAHDIRRTFSNLLGSAAVGAEVPVIKMAMNHAMSGDVTVTHYLNKVEKLRPHYERLEAVVLRKVGPPQAPTIEVDAEAFRQFQEYQAQMAKGRKPAARAREAHPYPKKT